MHVRGLFDESLFRNNPIQPYRIHGEGGSTIKKREVLCICKIGSIMHRWGSHAYILCVYGYIFVLDFLQFLLYYFCQIRDF